MPETRSNKKGQTSCGRSHTAKCCREQMPGAMKRSPPIGWFVNNPRKVSGFAHGVADYRERRIGGQQFDPAISVPDGNFTDRPPFMPDDTSGTLIGVCLPGPGHLSGAR